MNTYQKEFRVLAKSSNTNSFGLYQMILASKDGEAYKTHAGSLYAKEFGEVVMQTIKYADDGKVISADFIGTEMTTKLPQAPKGVLNELYQ